MDYYNRVVMPPGGTAVNESRGLPARPLDGRSRSPARRLWFRVWTVLLPAIVVFGVEVLRHEVLPDVLHDALPEMLGNVVTGAAALVISAVVLLPIYRRLQAADGQLQATRVTQAVTEERDRLARELHDTVAEALSFLNVKAAALDRSLSPVASGDAQPIAVEIAKAVQETSLRVRDAIFDLRTGPEPGEPLDAWIRSYARRFAELHGLSGDVVEQGHGRTLTLQNQLHAMAIVREALHNVAKHSQARTFAVRLEWTPAEMIIAVSDDGRGLPADLPGPSQGRYGLATLSEHAAAVGGSVTLSSGPGGAGTGVIFRMPYRVSP